eukprot:gb/GECG01005366.1/.p1 GENE.gb/GECG01005366.1/~~gb/GECG01005366.1/.p1  ORF type:complete len:1008 (+),score=162.67 gb/GECG01005366.1/:1-3024(+)
MSSSSPQINQLLSMEPPPPPPRMDSDDSDSSNEESAPRPPPPKRQDPRMKLQSQQDRSNRHATSRNQTSVDNIVDPNESTVSSASSGTSTAITQDQRSSKNSPLRSLPSLSVLPGSMQHEDEGGQEDNAEGQEQVVQSEEESDQPEDFKNLKVRYVNRSGRQEASKRSTNYGGSESAPSTPDQQRGYAGRREGPGKSKGKGETELEGASTLIPTGGGSGPPSPHSGNPSRHAAQMKNIERQIQRYVRTRSGQSERREENPDDTATLRNELLQTRQELHQTRNRLEEAEHNFSSRRARFIAHEREMQNRLQRENERHQKELQELRHQIENKNSTIKDYSVKIQQTKSDYVKLEADFQNVKRKLEENESNLQGAWSQVQQLNSELQHKKELISKLQSQQEQLGSLATDENNSHGECGAGRENVRSSVLTQPSKHSFARFLRFEFDRRTNVPGNESLSTRRRYSVPFSTPSFLSAVSKNDLYRNTGRQGTRRSSISVPSRLSWGKLVGEELPLMIVGRLSRRIRELKRENDEVEGSLRRECKQLKHKLAKKSNEVNEACHQVNESWKEKIATLRDTVRRDIAYRESKHKEHYQELENKYYQLAQQSDTELRKWEEHCKKLDKTMETLRGKLEEKSATAPNDKASFSRGTSTADNSEGSCETNGSAAHSDRHAASPRKNEKESRQEKNAGQEGRKEVPLTPVHIQHLVRGLDTAALKKCLAQAGISYDDCFEKADLQERLLEAATRGLTKMNSPAGSPAPSSEGRSPRNDDSNSKHKDHNIQRQAPDQNRETDETKMPPRWYHKRHSASADSRTPQSTSSMHAGVGWSSGNESSYDRQQSDEDDIRRRQQARLDEYKREAQKAEADAEEREKISGKVEARVKKWSNRKSLREMLMTLNSPLPGWDIPKAIAASAKTADSHSSLKKVYLKAVRIVHPDKVRSSDIKSQVQAHKVFTALAEAWSKFEEGVSTNKRPAPETRPPGRADFSRARRRYRSAAAPRYYSSRAGKPHP